MGSFIPYLACSKQYIWEVLYHTSREASSICEVLYHTSGSAIASSIYGKFYTIPRV